MNLIIEAGLKESLKPELSIVNQSLESFAKEADGNLGDLLSYVLINSGKRVRPALVYFGSQFGPADINAVRVVELVVELVHIATLVHDDVIDKAAMRRNKKTVAEEQGVDAAVLLGDYIYTTAFKKVAELGNPSLVQLMAESTALMCDGEIQQLKKRYQFDLTEKEYFSFIYKKTASLFGASARAGMILANRGETEQKAIENYGVNLGMAFQITDDLLDITGDEAVVGKTLRTDLANGKMTLPLIHYRNQLANDKSKDFFEIMKNPNGHTKELVDQIKKSNSIEYAESIAKKHVDEAIKNAKSLPAIKTRDHMVALAELLYQRTS